MAKKSSSAARAHLSSSRKRVVGPEALALSHVRTERGEPEERGLWGQVVNPVFGIARLIVPREGRQDPRETFSPAAARRQIAQRVELTLRTPPKNAGGELSKMGMDDVSALRVTRQPVSKKGIFARLESLGMTAAFFDEDKDLDEAESALADEYEFISDFPMSIPCRVQLADHPMNRSYAAPNRADLREWPDAGGVAKAHAAGVRGAGALVGVLDTGVDADHSEFARQRINYRYISLQPNSPFWPPRDVRGFDIDGHGTHVCGIIAGQKIGVAPEVGLYVASVIESETIKTSLTRVATGLNWIFREFTSPHNEHLPAVLSMSLGFPGPSELPNISKGDYEQRLKAMQTLLRTLIQANVLPVVAIGNDGSGKFGYPGAFDNVLGVGAIDFGGNIAKFSGSGHAPGQQNAKPDLVGYGVGVNSSLERNYEGESIYQRLNGTSMATPYVAGIAALYRSQNPSLTVEEVWHKLLDTALSLPNQKPGRVGVGLARFV